MYTYTLAGDESGDVSMSFGRGASRYFVLAIIATAEPEKLRLALEDVRMKAKLPETYEFKFHSLTSSSLRRLVFSSLLSMDFSAWAVVTDKTLLSAPFQKMDRMEFYLHFVTELLAAIPASYLRQSTLILDEFGSVTRAKAGLNRLLTQQGLRSNFKRIVFSRSRSEPLIQIADIVAGAILRRDTQKNTDAYEFISGKLAGILEVP
jgi:hypothetical protein